MTAPSQERLPGEDLTHRERLIILGGLLTGLLLSALDQTIVATALPTIVGEFGGLNQLSWVVTAYLLASTASMPLYGKLSDQFGRRIMFQSAIGVFLLGSVLCGVAQNMLQLIAFRAIQGIGGGGLMSLTFTIVGDIVPPRERGRYAGYLSGVFAFSSVAGPLVGGFLVDQLSWRWVFYVNVPIGAAALIATSLVLHLPFTRSRQNIDFLGAGLLVTSVTTLLLVTVWGGQQYAWTSPTILLLAAAGIGLALLFVWQESRAPEPIIPLRLFQNRAVSVSIIISVLTGVAMFGGMLFLPLFLQVVQNQSATNSGLLILPLMGGLLVSSIVSGRLVTRTGRYKALIVGGVGTAAVGMWLLSLMTRDVSRLQASASMIVLGAGIGAALPIMTIVVQNAVALRDLGAATSAVNFFRTLGGSVGSAAFGALLSARIASDLPRRLPPEAVAGIADPASLARSPSAIRSLPPNVASAVIDALAHAIHLVFLFGVPIVLVAFLASWLLPEERLRDTHAGETGPAAVEAQPAPVTEALA